MFDKQTRKKRVRESSKELSINLSSLRFETFVLSKSRLRAKYLILDPGWIEPYLSIRRTAVTRYHCNRNLFISSLRPAGAGSEPVSIKG